MSRFLRFVVEETLVAGRDAVKEVTVAIAVFDREPDFNPKVDPVVRNEARRLRGKLETYYTSEGARDGIRISIPKGGYAPQFERVEIPVTAAVEAPAPSPILEPAALTDHHVAISPEKPSSPRKVSLWMAAAVAVAVITGLGAMLNHGPTRTASAVSITPLTGDEGHDFNPAISPDGQSVAYSHEGPDGNVDIYVQSMSGEPRRLTTDVDNDLHPAWSPDGQSIAFIRAGPDTARIMVVPAAGGPEKQVAVPGRFDPGLTRMSAGPLERLSSPGPAWSPDGKFLVYRQCLPTRENGCPLHVVSLATLEVHRLTEQISRVADVMPAWSPDGKRIAFARFSANAPIGDLYVTTTDGAKVTRVTAESHDIRGLVWSGDGKSLVFSSDRTGTYSLWSVSLHDLAIKPINAVGETAIEPTISKDDQVLVYTDASTNVNVWRYDVGGRKSEKLIASTRQNRNAAWSRDGKRIAFISDRRGPWALWVANADGSQPAQLTKFAHGDFGSASWSPDSQSIAFEVRMEGQSAIWIIPSGGGTPRRLMVESEEQRSPLWSHDGQWIYFLSNRGGKFQIWRTHAAGSGTELVCDCVSTDMNETADGKSLILFNAPDRGFWEVPLPSGSARKIQNLEEINARRWWTLSGDALWFYDELQRQPGLFAYSFATRKVTHEMDFDRMLPVSTPSLAMSPDGRTLLYSRRDNSHSQLMSIRGPALER
jgi:Tol biopolymer transport system component